MPENPSPAAKPELLITRVFDAPRELVFKVWTEPEHIVHWWGPKDFTCPFAKIDLRVGGTFLYCMRSPDGHDFWTKGTFAEIIPPERLVYKDSFADENGNKISASEMGLPGDWPEETLVTVTFEALGDKTKVTLRHEGTPPEMAVPAEMGWNQSFDKVSAAIAMAS